MTVSRTIQSWIPVGVLATLLGVCAFAGCERKETVLDVDTPGADVEVERDVDTGEVEVETNND